jgi:hypothetical protein
MKVRLLLSSCGSEMYNTLHMSCLPAQPKEFSFDVLRRKLEATYEPSNIKYCVREKFSDRVQREAESIITFSQALKLLARNCQFGDALNERLTEAFINGVRSIALKKVLWDIQDVTFEAAYAAAVKFEAVESAALAATQSAVARVKLSGSQFPKRGGRGNKSNHHRGHSSHRGTAVSPRFTQSQSEPPHQFQPTRGQQPFRGGQETQRRGPVQAAHRPARHPAICWRCGRFHDPNTCPAKGWQCYVCRKFGHTSKFCSQRVGEVVSVQNNHEDECEEVEQIHVVSHISAEENHDIEVFQEPGYRHDFSCSLPALQVVSDHDDVKSVSSNESKSSNFCNASQGMVKSVSQAQLVYVTMDGCQVQMEIDTGSGFSLMSNEKFKYLFPQKEILPAHVKLKAVNGLSTAIHGKAKMGVLKSDNQSVFLDLLVCDGGKDFIPLLGRSWLDNLCPGWRSYFVPFWSNQEFMGYAKQASQVKGQGLSKEEESDLRKKYPNVFSEDKTKAIIGFKARLVLKDDAVPVVGKCYDIPLSMRVKVEACIRKWVEAKKLTPVTISRWASPIWFVLKKDGNVRIVVDFKRTVNPNLKIDQYPLPRVKDIFITLSGCKYFSILDLSEAYLQLEVTEESKELLTINTPWGFFQFNRLIYGVASAAPLFQQVMDVILVGIPKVGKYIDDIVIGGESLEKCQLCTNEVLRRLEKHCVQVNYNKCLFYRTSVQYLGHIVNAQGLQPMPEKVEAITKARSPKNVTELRAYLGLLNFYRDFIPNISQKLKPLNELLNVAKGNETGFAQRWSKQCESCFQESKNWLLSRNLLIHYDESKPIVLYTDASPYGVGSVLCHLVDGTEKPVMYHSMSLSPSQQRYSQLVREAFAVKVAVTALHKYLYGKKFKIVTDNLPLKNLISPNKGLPVVASPRIQSWAVALQAYSYEVEYRKSSLLAPADALSRLPRDEIAEEKVWEVCHIDVFEDLPLSA